MIGIFTNLFTSFLLGLATPLTAVCVLPLYPGFLSYLANKAKGSLARMGVLVSVGAVTFMTLLGLIFTTLLEKSLTSIIQIISPLAFLILIVMSIFLILNKDLGSLLPKANIPTAKNPTWNAFLYGFFFGAIVVPCQPAFIAAMFAKTAATTFTANVLNFFFFGIGIATPLLIFSLISIKASSSIISFLTNHKKRINQVSGVLMLLLSLYFLFFDFQILRWFI